MDEERSIFEIARLLQEYLGKASKELERYKHDNDEKHLENTRKMLEIIKDTDQKEIETIKKKLDDRKAKKECVELWKGAEKAEEYLENGEIDDVIEYLKKLIWLTKSVYGDIIKYDLTQDFQKGEFLGDGRNAEVYTLKNYDNLVMKLIHDDEWGNPARALNEFHKYMKIEESLPQKVKIARINQIGYYGNSAGIIMQKAPGVEAHKHPDSGEDNITYERWSEMNKQISEATEKDYRELAYTVNKLREKQLQVDPKSDNIFYHPQEGFTIIDIGMDKILTNKDTRYTPCLLSTLSGIKFKVADGTMYFDETKIDAKDIDNIGRIDKKLRNVNYSPNDESILENTREKIETLRKKAI